MWYTASILYESVHNQKVKEDDIWEEQIVLILAESESDAMAKAEMIGKRGEERYLSATNEKVRWTFRCVQSTYGLLDEELKHGTEVFSRFLRSSEARSLLTPLE